MARQRSSPVIYCLPLAFTRQEPTQLHFITQLHVTIRNPLSSSLCLQSLPYVSLPSLFSLSRTFPISQSFPYHTLATLIRGHDQVFMGVPVI